MPEGRDCQNPPQLGPQPRCNQEPVILILTFFWIFCDFLFVVISGYSGPEPGVLFHFANLQICICQVIDYISTRGPPHLVSLNPKLDLKIERQSSHLRHIYKCHNQHQIDQNTKFQIFPIIWIIGDKVKTVQHLQFQQIFYLYISYNKIDN